MQAIEPSYVAVNRPKSINELRAELRRIDAEIISAIAHRIRLCHDIGCIKLSAGASIRDRAVEDAVMLRGRAAALKHGLDPAFAKDVLRMLIEHAVECQQQLKHELESSWRRT